MSDTPTASRQTLLHAARVYVAGEPWERTGALKAAARAVIDARRSFTLRDGSPDWLGRGSLYRGWLADVLSTSPIPQERRPAFLAALRHHVSGLLREELTAEQLAELGLLPEDAVERVRRRRETYDRANQRTPPLYGPEVITDPDEVFALLDGIREALQRVRPHRYEPHLQQAVLHVIDAANVLLERVPGPPDEIIF